MREIPENYPAQIFQESEQRYSDPIEGKKIAIKALWYNGKMRPMMIAYEEKDDTIEIVTIHPIAEEKIINRIVRKRWIRDE